MIVFILDSHHHTAAQHTKNCLDILCPDWKALFIETDYAEIMNDSILTSSDPFFMTMYAGETFTASFNMELRSCLEKMDSKTSGIILIQVNHNTFRNRIISRGPVLWRTAAVKAGTDGGFATKNEFPFEDYVLQEKQYRLTPEWNWAVLETDGWFNHQVITSSWQQPEKVWEYLYPTIASKERIRSSGRPKVSVVICTYNDNDYIHWAIRSVIHQSFPDWELIIVNDASDDHTFNYLQSLSHPHIHIIHNDDNCGKSTSLNRALQVVRGDWLLELDADDWLAPDCIERLMDYASNDHETGVWYADHTEWLERSNKKLVYKQSIRSMPIFSATTLLAGYMPLAPRMYRVQILQDMNGWMTNDPHQGRLYEDYQILLRISLRFDIRYIPIPLYHRRLRNSSITHRMSASYEGWKNWIKQTLQFSGR
ncbi:MAG: glycosyl transferase family 2 [Paenibacillus sp.]|nr:glycosyl transferase family 2 [Paenibacillus sp.]